MKKRYLHVPVCGPVETFEVEAGDELRELQRRVGGWITSVGPQVQGHTVYVDDEGFLKGMDVNRRVSRVMRGYYVGDAVVVGLTDDEGDTGPVSDAVVRMFASLPVPVEVA